mgnify:CR=1 FL=1
MIQIENNTDITEKIVTIGTSSGVHARANGNPGVHEKSHRGHLPTIA